MNKQETAIILISIMILLVLVILGVFAIYSHYRKIQIRKKLDRIMPDPKQD